MVKAVSDVDSRRTDSIDELLRYWLECAPKLDFRKDLTAPPSDQSWASYAVDEVRLIKDSLRGILERDAVVLPVSAVAAVDALLDDPVLTALESTKKVVELHTRIRPDLTRLVMLGSDAPSAVEIRETFAGRVRHLVDEYIALCPEPQEYKLRAHAWRTDVAPSWGAGRVDGTPDPVEIVGMGPGDDMPSA